MKRDSNIPDLLSKVLIFAAGVAVGSVVAWKYFNSTIEIIEEDDQEEEGTKDPETIDEQEYVEQDIEIVHNICAEAGYDYSGCSANGVEKKQVIEEVDDMEKPYVIPPEEFGEDYETRSLTLYSDGVLVNEYGAVITDVEGLVGVESLTHFGEYEDDSVFVRNDLEETDFEILSDSRNYSDTV